MKQILVLLLSVTIVFLFSCGGNASQNDAKPESYKCLRVDTSTANMFFEYPVTIESSDVVEVHSMVTGYVTNAFAKSGQFVHKGDVLVLLDSREFQANADAAAANVSNAKTNVAKAELDVKKLTPLVEKGIISEYELETAKSTLESAKSMLESAESQYKSKLVELGYTTIKAPISGYITNIEPSEGEIVTSGTSLITKIASSGDVNATFTVAERDILEIDETFSRFPNITSILDYMNSHWSIRLILSSEKVFENPGILKVGSGILESATGTLKLKAVFKDDNDKIYSGGSGRVRMEYKSTGSIVIPQSACYELQDKYMLYVVNSDNTVHARNISVSPAVGNKYKVTSGLSVGDVILLEGIGHVHEGAVIEPVFE